MKLRWWSNEPGSAFPALSTSSTRNPYTAPLTGMVTSDTRWIPGLDRRHRVRVLVTAVHGLVGQTGRQIDRRHLDHDLVAARVHGDAGRRQIRERRRRVRRGEGGEYDE